MPDEMDIGQQNATEEYDPAEFLPESYKPMIEENEYEVLIPKTRMQYFVEHRPELEALLKTYKLELNFNVEKHTVFAKTTQETFDPTSILIARQFLRLVARFVDIPIAQTVWKPNVESEIISTSLCHSQETFLKRRERFVGENGQTLKALELLTNTRMKVYGSTLAVIGSPRGIQLVQRIVKDCFAKNVLPTFWIKTLMVRRELEKMPEMADQDWSNFLPQLKKSSSRRKSHAADYKPKLPVEERGITDVGKFTERKIDKLMESGKGGFRGQPAKKGKK